MKNEHRKGLSIKFVAALYSVITISVLTIVVVFIGYHLFENNVRENYEKYAVTVLENAYIITTDYSFGDMIAARDMTDGYEDMRLRLNKIKENSDIDYLYAIYFDDIDDIHSLTYAINTKTTEELEAGGTYTYLGTPCEEGSFEDDTLLLLQEAVKESRESSSVLEGHSDEYGYMLNGYKVIFDSEGNPVGLLCVEIDTNEISTVLGKYVRTIIIVVTILTFIAILIYIIKIEVSLIYPITSITDAAKVLHVTQPTLSRQLAQLEQEMGAPLFTRGRTGVELTDRGAVLNRYARDILELADKAEEEVAMPVSSVTGTVHIGAGETRAFSVLATACARVRKRYPGITFDVHDGTSADLKEHFARGFYDFLLDCDSEPAGIART